MASTMLHLVTGACPALPLSVPVEGGDYGLGISLFAGAQKRAQCLVDYQQMELERNNMYGELKCQGQTI